MFSKPHIIRPNAGASRASGAAKPKRRHRLGNAVLDAALVLPVLLSITFGAVEYGYFFFVKHSLQGAAREGARAAIVPTAANSDVTTAVATSLKAAGLNSSTSSLDSKYSLVLSPSNVATATSGTAVTVTIQTTWGVIGVHALPTMMGGITSTKQVKGVTVMRKEG